MNTGKKLWALPKLTVLGDVEEITLGFSVGEHLDATFPTGTLKGNITFS